jgi:ribonuclease HI
MVEIKVYVDGSGEAKNGLCHYGYHIESGAIAGSNKGRIFSREGITSNEAEYWAVIKALEAVETDSNVVIYSDSKLVVNQIRGIWNVVDSKMLEKVEYVRGLVDFKRLKVKFIWIPRRQNIVGDIMEKYIRDCTTYLHKKGVEFDRKEGKDSIILTIKKKKDKW